MNKLKSVFFTSALAFVMATPLGSWAEKIKKHVDSEGFEDWYWKDSVKVSSGSPHTFWIKGLTADTAITDMDVYCEYKYTEDGETYEDIVYASESCEVMNSSGGWDKYVLLTSEDWEAVQSTKSTLTFTVYVGGWGGDEYSSADLSFTFGHAEGESSYPGDQEPAYVAPKGTSGNPQTITLTDLKVGESPATSAKMVDCDVADDIGTTYYIKTSSLTAGHRYFFGIDAGSDFKLYSSISGGENLFDDKSKCKEYNGWANAREAYEFVPQVGGVYYLTVNVGGTSEADAGVSLFTIYHAAQPALTPDKHDFTELAVGAVSEPFAPGYLNDPESGAYDEVVDQKLFRVTGYKKGDNIVFRTEGAAADLMMRLYDAKGNILAENFRVGDDSSEVQVVWTATAAYSASSAVYVGVCQQLDEDEEPSAGEVIVSATLVSLENPVTPLSVVPDGASRSPAEADGAVPSEERTLSATEWVNTFVVAARAGVAYRVKAACDVPNGLTLAASVYTLSGTTKKTVNPTGSLAPEADGWFEFTPSAHGNVYIDVSVANAKGEYGDGKGLAYGPYVLYATAAGSNLGILTVPMKGASESEMGWKILSGPGITASKEVFYAAGTSAILAAGDYVLVAKEVKGFAKPDAKGYTTVPVVAGTSPKQADEYKYTDTADPLDDLPDAKAKHPTLGKAYAPTKLDPKSGKPAEALHSLWNNDLADWYTLTAAAGSVYRFTLAEKTGASKMAVYGPDNWTKECTYTTFKDPEEMLQVSASAKGTYYVKVFHADEGAPEDSSYTLSASVATPGVIKLAKTAISVKDTAGYADVSVSRTGKDGVVRVKFATSGSQTSAEDAYYYPTNGVLTWAAGDNKAKTVRVRIVPNSGWDTNKTVNVVFSTFSDEDETFDAANEFVPGFETDKKTGLPLDTAAITITPTAKKVPGTIQVADCATPKKPILSVTADETLEIPFERIGGSDGIVGVKVETVKGTANKSGEVDFTPVTTELVWQEGETDAKVVSVSTKKVAGDYTAVKTFTLKLTALTSKKGDAVAYDKPSLAASAITVNIVNDKFAEAFDAYAKTVTDAKDGYTVKAGKKETWVVLADGSFYAPNKGDLAFTFKTTGTFRYKIDGGEEQVFVATAKNKSLTIKGAASFEIVGYELDGEPVALRQGVKYEASFGNEGTVKAANLPGGLKLAQDKVTKEWIVAGVPSKAGIFQAVYTTTVGKTSNDKAVCYTVAAQGTSAGTFNGLATTFDTTNGVPTLASVTITAAVGGKLSAKVAIAGKSYTFADTGYSYVTGDPDDPDVPAYVTAELALVQKIGSGKDASTVTNWLYYTVMDVPETDAEGWRSKGEVEIQMAALPDAKGSGFQEDVWYFGKVCRDNSKSGKDGKAAWEAAMAAHAGYYTVALVAPDAMPCEPRGSGYITLTLDAKGKAKVAGKLADGTAYSSSATATLAGEEDNPYVRVPPFACKGTYVFGGWLSIKADEKGVPVAMIDSPDTDLVWKNDDPASTRDGEEGFALYLYPVGGWYDTVSNLQRSYLESDLSVDVPEGDDALEELMDSLALGDGYAFVAQPSGEAVDLLGNTLSVAKQALAKGASKKVIDWAASVNASNVKLTFKRATGIVSGTFDLWYEGTNAKGAFEQKSVSGLKHEGVLVLSRGDDGYLEDEVLSSGYFLAPQEFKYKDAKGKDQKRKWNGSYRFDINAVHVDRTWTDYTEE